MKFTLKLSLFVLGVAACNAKPPPVNDFIDLTANDYAQQWIDEMFIAENPNLTEYRFVKVNSDPLVNNIKNIQVRLLSDEIVIATRTTGKANDESNYWTGRIDGTLGSRVEILRTHNPFLRGYIVVGDRCEFFENAMPYADSIMYRITMPQRSFSSQADILPDADLAVADDAAWRCRVDSLPASAYRIVRLDAEVWRAKIEELELTGATEMRFFDDTRYRVLKAGTAYPRIGDDELSSMSLHNFGGKAGFRGGVRSRQTGAVRVSALDDSGLYAIWVMHPNFRKLID